MALDSLLGKKYKLSSSEKFDEYMKALGVGLITRKVGNTVSPVVELNKDGEEYVLTSNSTFKNVITKFKPGQEFDQETPDGRKVKATITVEGNTLKEVQKGGDGKVTTIDRTWTDDEIKMDSTNRRGGGGGGGSGGGTGEKGPTFWPQLERYDSGRYYCH